ncbi:type II toxin-antitoxin system HigA family antitoxin [Dyadobacter sp. CY347]|uniref:helix-turn-helix domain-containing protein n=1 Tax=Dyadobacter sp. CY347 TaxID=2909336 RepID=UPI001F459C86|nr:transcriptional regulator [Dyadobacter sp. CY347]MCF2490807.1 transcriptional regulator [Dyadobacter sp. CY347]
MKNYKIKPLKSTADYKEALDNLREVWEAQPNTPEGDQLELLLMVIEKYEDEHHQMPQLDPVEAIKYKMEEDGLSQKDLVKYFGTKSRVSEVLGGKKPLTLKMIKSLYHDFGIPAKTLLI